ncbi:MAG: TlpA disulfide reductase family protein [Acidimicrobiales bacterium]
MGRELRPGREGTPVEHAVGRSARRRPEGVARHRRHAAAAGLTALMLAGVGFVAYATVMSREVPTPKYANLVLYASPAKAPGFDLARLGSGARVTSEVLGNGPAVLNWFQSTCVACQAELGTFAAVADQDRKRIHFLGVDINDPSPAAALAMVRRAGAAYPVAEAPGIESISLATRFGVGDLPATVFVSAHGRILGEVLGKVSRAELVALLANLAAGRPLNS